MRRVVEAVPDGLYEFEDSLDGEAAGGCAGPRIRVRVSVEGDAVTLDFTGTDREVDGPLNCVLAVTQSAVRYCFMCLLVTPSALTGPAADPSAFLNDGCFRSIAVVAPEGTIVNARPPRAVSAGNVETSQRIVDVVLGALSQALPEIIPAASQGTMNNLTLGGHDPRRGRPFTYYETMAGGMGARPGADGIDAVHVHMTNTMNTPVEALEFACPLRVERYEITPDTGGSGTHRGGCGLRRDTRVLVDATGALIAERRETAPYGLAGGEPGVPGDDAIIRNGERMPVKGKCSLELKAGDVISIRTPGGGGWGAGGTKDEGGGS